jgi:hypothetical protein
MMRPSDQADLVEQRLCARLGVAGAGDLHRHGDVLERRERRDEVKELEDEADLLATESGEAVFAELGDVDAVDQHVTRARRVQPGNQPEQRGLAAARGTDDRHELASGDVERDRMQDRERLGAADDGLGDVPE